MQASVPLCLWKRATDETEETENENETETESESGQTGKMVCPEL